MIRNNSADCSSTHRLRRGHHRRGSSVELAVNTTVLTCVASGTDLPADFPRTSDHFFEIPMPRSLSIKSPQHFSLWILQRTRLEFRMNTSQPSTSNEGSSASGWPNDAEALTIFTFAHVFSSEERAMELCTTTGLLPDRKSTPPPSCPKCQGGMRSKSSKNNFLKFNYRCRNTTETLSGATSAKKAKTTSKACHGSTSPLRNTFFEGIFPY